jgi:hypothetical protein
MYFKFRPQTVFHENYSDIGFHFASDAHFLDLSKRQKNPPNLQVVQVRPLVIIGKVFIFDKFVRPTVFKMTNGGTVPFGKGSNLFIDNNGLIGGIVADKSIRHERRATPGIRSAQNYQFRIR